MGGNVFPSREGEDAFFFLAFTPGTVRKPPNISSISDKGGRAFLPGAVRESPPHPSSHAVCVREQRAFYSLPNSGAGTKPAACLNPPRVHNALATGEQVSAFVDP